MEVRLSQSDWKSARELSVLFKFKKIFFIITYLSTATYLSVWQFVGIGNLVWIISDLLSFWDDLAEHKVTQFGRHWLVEWWSQVRHHQVTPVLSNSRGLSLLENLNLTYCLPIIIIIIIIVQFYNASNAYIKATVISCSYSKQGWLRPAWYLFIWLTWSCGDILKLDVSLELY